LKHLSSQDYKNTLEQGSASSYHSGTLRGNKSGQNIFCLEKGRHAAKLLRKKKKKKRKRRKKKESLCTSSLKLKPLHLSFSSAFPQKEGKALKSGDSFSSQEECLKKEREREVHRRGRAEKEDLSYSGKEGYETSETEQNRVGYIRTGWGIWE